MLVQGSQTANALAGLLQAPPQQVELLVAEMRKDYQLNLAERVLVSGAEQVKVTFKTTDGDASAKAVRDHVEKEFYRKRSAMMNFIAYGRVAFEKAWKYVPEAGVHVCDLNELPYKQTKMILRNGKFSGIRLDGKTEDGQKSQVDLGEIYAWWLAMDATPTEPHGKSRFLGAACNTWLDRKNTRRLLRIFLDKFALGSRIIRGPEYLDDPTNTDPNAPKIRFADVIQNAIVPYEAGGSLVLSNKRQVSVGATGQQDVGYEIEVDNDNAQPQDSAPLLAVIAEQDSWQLLSMGIPPKTVTEGAEQGSFAMVAQQRIVLLAVFEDIFLQLREQFQTGVIDPMVAMNGCAPVTMDYTPLTERPDDLASEVVKAWLTNPKLSELVSSGTVDMIAMLEACGVPVTQEGHERLTKLITRLANPPAQPTNPDGTVKTPEQLKAEYAVKTGQDPDEIDDKKSPPPLSASPFLMSLWPGGERESTSVAV